MTPQQLLNSDLRTIGLLLRDGWRGWLDELQDLMPRRFADRSARQRAAKIDSDGKLLLLDTRSRSTGDAVVGLDPSLALVRCIEMPTMNGRDLSRMLEFESDRYFPFAGGGALIAHRIVARRSDSPGMQVEVAALPSGTAGKIARQLDDAGLQPIAVVLDSHSEADSQLDFGPVMREAGLIRASAGRSHWWLAVATLFALNVGALIWRDVSTVDSLEQLVAQQAPAVAGAQRIARVAERSDRSARLLSARRIEPTALGTLGLVSMTLPDTAWVQRYSWSDDTVRLTGYQVGPGNLVSELRASRRFATVRPAQAESLGATPAGRPFDLNLVLRRSRS